MRPDLQLAHLKTLIVIDKQGSFSAAADVLGRSQSAITQQMQNLELAVGRPIFEIVGRGRQLTIAGQELLRHAHEIVRMCSTAVISAERRYDSRTIRIGAPLELANAIMPDVMRDFAKLYPHSRIHLNIDRSRALMEALEAGGLDIAVSTWRRGVREGRLLKMLRVHWVAARSWTMPENGPLPLVLTDEPSMFRRICLNALELVGVPHYERLTTHSPAGVRFAVEAGLGITARTLSTFRSDIQVLGPEFGLPSLPRVSYYLHHSSHQSSEEIDSLCKLLESHEMDGSAVE
ncbi:MAG: LysR family transcriptional regulator [Rhodobacteraceae bacterium]|nr:LysR family transcriptional regulator [Paracoccaceae bacterium]